MSMFPDERETKATPRLEPDAIAWLEELHRHRRIPEAHLTLVEQACLVDLQAFGYAIYDRARTEFRITQAGDRALETGSYRRYMAA
jgi:hypothetical protein